jgi:hypothetical protein
MGVQDEQLSSFQSVQSYSDPLMFFFWGPFLKAILCSDPLLDLKVYLIGCSGISLSNSEIGGMARTHRC